MTGGEKPAAELSPTSTLVPWRLPSDGLTGLLDKEAAKFVAVAEWMENVEETQR